MTERLWFKIGETAALVGATPKELRYWERVIPELKPRRSKGNLRYYHQDELAKLQRIRQWLSEGFTVADCRELLGGQSFVPSKTPAAESGQIAQPRDFAGVLEALRALCERLRHPVGEIPSPRPEAPRQHRKTSRSRTEAPPPQSPPTPAPKPKPKPKSKPDPSPLGRMWSESRLPLDWEE